MKRLLDWLRLVPDRARRGLARRGAGGFARESVLHVEKLVRLQEEHLWYELRLGELPASPPLDDGLRLVVADDEQLEQVIGQNVTVARRRAAAGNDQMMLFEGDQAISSACIFRREVPVLAAPGRKLRLWEHTVCIEDSNTTREARRRGRSAVAFLAVAARLREQGIQGMLTKIAVDNRGARIAAARLGFEPIARVRLDRVGPFKRVDVELLSDAPAAVKLARALGKPDAPRAPAAHV